MIGREVRKIEIEFVPFLELQSGTKEEPMSETLINLIIQLIAGALGGNGGGNALKDLNLGPWATRSRARSVVWPAVNFFRH
jgi:hypothetical protein